MKIGTKGLDAHAEVILLLIGFELGFSNLSTEFLDGFLEIRYLYFAEET